MAESFNIDEIVLGIEYDLLNNIFSRNRLMLSPMIDIGTTIGANGA